MYYITDKTTNQFYIGSRKGNVELRLTPVEDLFVEYFTSGTISDGIKQEPSNFEYKILFAYGEYDVVYWYEQLLIRERIKSSNCINKKFIDPDTGKDAFYCKGHTEETKQKMSASKIGVKNSNDTILKFKSAASNRPASHYDCHRGPKQWKRDRITITDGIINIQITKTDDLPDGFRYGITQFNKRKPKTTKHHCYTNGVDNVRILDSLEPPFGYTFGRTCKSNKTWEITLPNGDIEVSNNLSKFCREQPMKLDSTELAKISKNTTRDYHGYRCKQL